MKSLVLTLFIAVSSMFMGTQTAVAGDCCESSEKCCESSECNDCKKSCNRCFCIKRKVCTNEECREYFCKTKCVCGCKKTIHYVEITYKTKYADCCGNCSHKTFRVTRRVCKCDLPNWDKI